LSCVRSTLTTATRLSGLSTASRALRTAG
jgi:hypothetical protein